MMRVTHSKVNNFDNLIRFSIIEYIRVSNGEGGPLKGEFELKFDSTSWSMTLSLTKMLNIVRDHLSASHP